jgi:NADH dehydrogenase FAD-containing subunit
LISGWLKNQFDDVERREHFEKYQVSVTTVNFKRKTIECRSAIGSQRPNQLEGEGMFGGVEKEKMGIMAVKSKFILFPGAGTNIFSTPGVKENCLFLKTRQSKTHPHSRNESSTVSKLPLSRPSQHCKREKQYILPF